MEAIHDLSHGYTTHKTQYMCNFIFRSFFIWKTHATVLFLEKHKIQNTQVKRIKKNKNK